MFTQTKKVSLFFHSNLICQLCILEMHEFIKLNLRLNLDLQTTDQILTVIRFEQLKTLKSLFHNNYDAYRDEDLMIRCKNDIWKSIQLKIQADWKGASECNSKQRTVCAPSSSIIQSRTV